MSSDTTFDHEELVQKLDKKNNDLELAAKIGQSLLEQNRDLQTKNEFLEESVSRNLDTIIQLKHELNQRIELLRVYSHLDDDGFPRSNSDETLRERLKLSRSENERLRRECDALRQETASMTSLERRNNLELEKQLDDANEKITNLQFKIEQKTQELNSQYESTGKLVKELANKTKNEKMLTMEKEEMSSILIEMIQKHDSMNGELKDMQNQYAELMANFAETESELARLRQNASLRMSFDSLYDSLASEMENSDSNHPRQLTSQAIDSGVETSLAAELSEPEKIETPKAVDYYSKQHTAAIQCDASTSCTDIFIESTQKLSIKNENDDKEKQKLEEQSFPEPEATSTPIVRRKFSSFISPIRSNSRLASPLRSVHSPVQRQQLNESDEEQRHQYEEPKMGQPGIPGTRDLDYSLKIIKVKEEVQKEFDAFCQRKGINQKSFFGSSKNRESSFSKSQDSWIDYGSFFGATTAQKSLALPNSQQQPLSLSLTRHGVLTRAELRNPIISPTSSPQHSRSPLNFLASSSSCNPNTNIHGAQNGVLQRR
ncbi:unnamed protein product [Caenorhabditis angaria]|uniref:HAP1 N-terminal domain-containing protein n=1 Tax=Caenorhabditis angaria TaxID=860376 RepID=A0A9P1I401_9PELO|nr:unnamed protein product [Caenorhabditis angaria]